LSLGGQTKATAERGTIILKRLIFGSLLAGTVTDDPSLTTAVGSGKVYAPVVIIKYRECHVLLGSVGDDSGSFGHNRSARPALDCWIY